MQLKTKRQEKIIINNVVNSVYKGIEYLNKQGYDFLYLSSGFIAHYSINGFKDYYSYNSLKDIILNNQSYNQYNNFNESDKDYLYYKQKAFIYNEICKAINTNIQTSFC